MHFNSLIPISMLLASVSHASPTRTSKLPVVDLGYERHEAISYNSSTEVYQFSNIRYAQPPVGDLRFRAPRPPLTNRNEIQNGSQPRTCPQGVAGWQARAFGPIGAFTNGKPFTLEAWEQAIQNSSIPPIDFNKASSEDCLFLDVHVPKKIFKSKCGAPVLVWIHGGGYAFGSKNGSPTPGFVPSGLLEHAKEFSDNGMIFVGLNYRLGALGFLSGQEVEQDGDLNAGLLDQRLALQWVQDNIHLFGGSRDKVTVMGESAGGGSVLLHMTGPSNSTNIKAPFAQAIVQSPALVSNLQVPESGYADFLSQLNVSSLADARKLSSEAIIRGNADHLASAPDTTYIHTPVRDSKTAPDTLYQSFKNGAFDKTVRLLAAHNSFEGSFFFDPKVKTEEQLDSWIQNSLPGYTKNDREYLVKDLYPFNLSLGDVAQGSSQRAIWGDAIFDCTFLTAHEAFGGNSYAYLFDVSPGFHTQDLKYTFNDPATPAFRPIAQDILQRAIASFTINGEPVTKSNGTYEAFPTWGSGKSLVRINGDGFSVGTSVVNETRCAWWQSGYELSE
uniref:Carboxylic ester hydrolase n=1 Tax=Bionectria ochroleuca TaxID=29856 RepID=A0A8H7K424_BIOOC